jgi:hypothetical protein
MGDKSLESANIELFFNWARERQRILLRRQHGKPKPWSEDPTFQKNRFCNVSREDDKTTKWFRENVRDKLSESPEESLAGITVFRWFNKIETGEILKDLILGHWSTEAASERLLHVKPVVTGAYIIKTPDGMDKMTGVLWCIDRFIENMEKGIFDKVLEGNATMQETCEMLQDSPFLGRFMAYQICADAQYTCLLRNAPDIYSWAQPGPGSTRGIGRVFFNDPEKFRYGSPKDEKEVIKYMQQLLHESNNARYWPQEWFPWDMQTVQNVACEVDKYIRCTEGGHMKRKFA